MNDYLILDGVEFSEPVPVFSDDILVLDFKQRKLLVLNNRGLVIKCYEFEAKDNG